MSEELWSEININEVPVPLLPYSLTRVGDCALQSSVNRNRSVVTQPLFSLTSLSSLARLTDKWQLKLNAQKLEIMLHYLQKFMFTARAYARAVLGVVMLSVCLSHAWIVTKLNDALQIFLYHTKGQSLCYSDTKSG